VWSVYLLLQMLALLLVSTLAGAQPLHGPLPARREPPTAARLEQLARSPTWLRLIHQARGPSEIHPEGFFLAPQGDRDPLAELLATLAAGRQAWPVAETAQALTGRDVAPGLPPAGAVEARNVEGRRARARRARAAMHPHCRFAARYAWLAEQGVIDDPAAVSGPLGPETAGRLPFDARCQVLKDWLPWGQLEGASLLFVSGYLGNPASTFGHALLRFDTREGRQVQGQTDVAVNFGADVPEGENLPRYLWKGIFGGYAAAFSDQPFYANDLVYAHNEFRDLWVYRLALDPAALRLLALHVWEVLGEPYDYYFFDRNCALRLAELIELATGRDLIGPTAPWLWYAPVELFEALHRLDASPPGLLDGPPQFRPSAERLLAARYRALSPALQALAGQFMADQAPDIERLMRGLPVAQQLDLLDFGLSWYDYRQAGRPDGVDPFLRTLKDRLLLARLRRPPRALAPADPEPLPSPALGHSPGLLGLGLQVGPGPQRLMWQAAAFSYEQGGFHGLNQGELALLDLRGGIDLVAGQAGGRVRLDALDLLRLDKRGGAGQLVQGGAALAWRFRTGWQRDPVQGPDGRPEALRFGLDGGLGAAWQLGALEAWARALGGLRSGLGGHAGLAGGAELGASWRQGPWQVLAGRTVWPATAATAWPSATRFELVHALGRQDALRLIWHGGGPDRSIQWRWQHFL
jgi:hypothetical protein